MANREFSIYRFEGSYADNIERFMADIALALNMNHKLVEGTQYREEILYLGTDDNNGFYLASGISSGMVTGINVFTYINGVKTNNLAMSFNDQNRVMYYILNDDKTAALFGNDNKNIRNGYSKAINENNEVGYIFTGIMSGTNSQGLFGFNIGFQYFTIDMLRNTKLINLFPAALMNDITYVATDLFIEAVGEYISTDACAFFELNGEDYIILSVFSAASRMRPVIHLGKH